MNAIPTQSELESVVTSALQRLFRHDAHLLDADANERSISHRLAIYIQEALPTWDVDCEYNRNGHDPKTTMLPIEDTTTDDEDARTVYPDIIIHHRNTDDNLLAIEIKKSSSNVSSDRDEQKLTSYGRQPLRYAHALFLKLRTDHRQNEQWILKWLSTETPIHF